jgi:hypothetical protein
MEILESEKEELKKYAFPWYEQADKALNILYNKIIEQVEAQICMRLGYEFSSKEKETVKQLIFKYGAREVIESVFICLEQYIDVEDDESFEKIVDYVGRICFTRSKNKYGGMYGTVNYIVKIAKNRFSYVNERVLKNILFKHMTIDNMEEIKNITANSNNWTDLKQKLCEELNIDLEKF